jgi:hypothetical protein
MAPRRPAAIRLGAAKTPEKPKPATVHEHWRMTAKSRLASARYCSKAVAKSRTDTIKLNDFNHYVLIAG